MIIAIMIIY